MREKPRPPKRVVPDIPKPTILRRAASYTEFTELRDEGFLLLGSDSFPSSADTANGPPVAEVPPRPKSRNDVEATGYPDIPGKATAKHPRNFRKELDLLQWYEDFEDEMQDAANDEYKCVAMALLSH